MALESDAAALQSSALTPNSAVCLEMHSKREVAPEFVVLSREDAERYGPLAHEICISISERDEPSDVLFAEDHARAIREFLDSWPNAKRVVVHCNAGVSRSPGVALGLCDLRGWATAALERSHPGWNRHVRSVLAPRRKA